MVFVDSNVPMYVAGRDHPLRDRARRFLERARSGDVDICTSTEVLQEILYRYHHLNEVKKGFQVFETFARTIPVIYPVFLGDMLKAKELLHKHVDIRPRDALHAALMLNRGLDTIVSYDLHFDQIPGIKRVEP